MHAEYIWKVRASAEEWEASIIGVFTLVIARGLAGLGAQRLNGYSPTIGRIGC